MLSPSLLLSADAVICRPKQPKIRTCTMTFTPSSIVRHAMIVLIIAANHVTRSRQSPAGGQTNYGHDTECPPTYWDEPSKRCSESLHAVLEEIRTSDLLISAEMRLNKTCREWDRTNACYQQLIQKCHSDATALHELRIHIDRYVIYSRPCQDPSLRYRKNLADCFLPDIKSTRTCTEAIDKYLRKFVVNKDYRSACRVVSTAMKCFHDIKNNIKLRCRQEGADEYQNNYIRPLVEQTRATVLSECKLSSPYKEYFLNSGAASASLTLSASSTPIRWRHAAASSSLTRTVSAIMPAVFAVLVVDLVVATSAASRWTALMVALATGLMAWICRLMTAGPRRAFIIILVDCCCRHQLALGVAAVWQAFSFTRRRQRLRSCLAEVTSTDVPVTRRSSSI